MADAVVVAVGGGAAAGVGVLAVGVWRGDIFAPLLPSWFCLRRLIWELLLVQQKREGGSLA